LRSSLNTCRSSLSLSLTHTHTHTHTDKFAAPSNQIQALQLIFQSFKHGTHFTAKSAMGLEDQAGSIDQNNISIIKVSLSSRLEYLELTFCCFHKSPPFRKAHTQQKHVTSFFAKDSKLLEMSSKLRRVSQRLDF
jgi:hypothetical protein